MINKATISMIIGLVLIIIKLATGVTVGDDVQNQIVEIVMSLISGGMVLYGLIRKIMNK